MSSPAARAVYFIVRGTVYIVAGSIYLATISLLSCKIGTPLGYAVLDNTKLLREPETALAEKLKSNDPNALATVQRRRRSVLMVFPMVTQWLIWAFAATLELSTMGAAHDDKLHSLEDKEIAELFGWSAVAAVGLFAVMNVLILLIRRALRYVMA